MLKLRNPASTCATGMFSFAAPSAPAIVAFVDFLNAFQGFSCLLAMRARTNTKVVVRHGYLKIAKYAIGHVDVIVLPGVDNHFIVALS